MTIRHNLSLVSVFVTIAIAGCESASSPSSVTLYALDGREAQSEPVEGKELFHAYEVLGKVEISKSEERIKLVTALHKGITNSDGTRADCFWPRHGLRMVNRDKTTDYLICFQCYRVTEFNGEAKESTTITQDPQALFNDVLTEHGIALPPR